MECIDTLKDALKQCAEGKCVECPLKKDPECMSHLANRSSEYIKELEIQLKIYHKPIEDNLKSALEHEKNLNQQIMGRLDTYESIVRMTLKILVDAATDRG